MGRLFLYPLRMAALLVIALWSVSLTLALAVPIAGIPLFLLLLSWFWKYSIAVLDAAMAGAAEPPALAVEMLSPFSDLRSFLVMLVFILMMFTSGAISAAAGPVLATIFAVAVAVVMPAILGLFASTRNLRIVFAPEEWLKLIRRLGIDYAILLAGVAALAMVATLGAVLRASDRLPTILAFALYLYVWLAAVSLIGGVLYERRADSGIDNLLIPVRTMQADPHLAQRRRQFIDRLYAESRNGAYVNAWNDLQEEINREGQPLEELRWIYPAVARWPDPLIANRLAQEFLPQLLAKREFPEALRIVQDRLRAAPDFHLRTSADLFRLATFARDVGDKPTARALLGNFARFYPEAPERKQVDAIARELAR